MKKQLLPFTAGVLAVLILLEVLFRILPVSTATRSGYHIHPLIITYPPHHCFTAATGWDLKNAQRNCANNYGFLADRDFVQDPQAIALIGDSFVEANMLPAKQRLGAQLQAKIPTRAVYTMGGPGSSLLDYAERAKFAAEKFGIRTFVFVLERGDIKQAICASGNIHGPCLDPKTLAPRITLQPEASGLKRVMRESALAQYIFSQIRFDFAKVILRLTRQTSTTNIEPNTTPEALTDATSTRIVSVFLEKIAPIRGARFLFVIDADRLHLSTDALTNENPELEILKAAITAIDATPIDPTDAFRSYVTQSGKILDVGPYDRHWNSVALNMLAKLIAERLLPTGISPTP